MTKKQLYFILTVVMVVLGVAAYFLINKKSTSGPLRPTKPTTAPAQEVLRPNGRRVINPSTQDPKVLNHLRPSNMVSETWKENVERALRVQGASSLKEVEIIKVESLIWVQHGIALYVESVKIGLVNQKGETTRFDALVDSQSGKILQTFNHPVIDPANPREQFRVKIDPRYHTE
jgi:hypothetical protein